MLPGFLLIGAKSPLCFLLPALCLLPILTSHHSYFCLAAWSLALNLPTSHLPHPASVSYFPLPIPAPCHSHFTLLIVLHFPQFPTCASPSHISLLLHHPSNLHHSFVSSKQISLAYHPLTNDHMAPMVDSESMVYFWKLVHQVSPRKTKDPSESMVSQLELRCVLGPF